MVEIFTRETLVIFSWLRFLVTIVTIIERRNYTEFAAKSLRQLHASYFTYFAPLNFLPRPSLFRLESEVEQWSAPLKTFAVIILTTA